MGQEDANHLIKAIKENNNLGEDPEGSNYIGISLNWDISKGKAHLSRPGYVEEALQWFKHTWISKIEDQQYVHVIPNYGANVQYTQEADKSQSANKEENIFV